jgi:hypothetical protein
LQFGVLATVIKNLKYKTVVEIKIDSDFKNLNANLAPRNIAAIRAGDSGTAILARPPIRLSLKSYVFLFQSLIVGSR